MCYVLLKFGIHHVSLNVWKKYMPLVFQLEGLVIMLLVYDHILIHGIMYNFPSWRPWCSLLWQHVVLRVDTTVLEEHATFIIRVEMNRVRIHLGFIGRLQGRHFPLHICYGLVLSMFPPVTAHCGLWKEPFCVLVFPFSLHHSYWSRLGAVCYPAPVDLIDHNLCLIVSSYTIQRWK